MRLHMSREAADALPGILQRVGVSAAVKSEHRSQTRAIGIELQLWGASPRYPQAGRDEYDHHAASWDQWGQVLAALYDVDSDMFVGSQRHAVYRNRGDFHYRTDWRFFDGGPDELHHAHRWQYDGEPCANTCTRCGAVRRWSA